MPLIEHSALVLALWALIGYLFGSVPFGVLISRVMNLGDLRAIGSGNIGATNVLRTGNKTAALLTLLLDGGKAAVAVLLARAMAGEDAAQLAGLWRSSVIASPSGCASRAAKASPHSSG